MKKGLVAERLAMDVIGKMLPDVNATELGYFREALLYLRRSNSTFADNVMRVVGSGSLEGSQNNVIAYLCSGASSSQDVLRKIEEAGLLNSYSDGGLKKTWDEFKPQREQVKKFAEKQGKDLSTFAKRLILVIGGIFLFSAAMVIILSLSLAK